MVKISACTSVEESKIASATPLLPETRPEPRLDAPAARKFRFTLGAGASDAAPARRWAWNRQVGDAKNGVALTASRDYDSNNNSQIETQGQIRKNSTRGLRGLRASNICLRDKSLHGLPSFLGRVSSNQLKPRKTSCNFTGAAPCTRL